MSESPSGTRKWWLEAAYVTALSAAIIVPGVTALDHWLDFQLQTAKQEHEIRLAEQKQAQEVRQTYLDRAVDPHRSADYRRSVLTFLRDTLDEREPMRRWATAELGRLERALEAASRLAAAEAESKRLQLQLANLNASSGRVEQRRKEIERALAESDKEVRSLTEQLDQAKKDANIDDPPAAADQPSEPSREGRQDVEPAGKAEQQARGGGGGGSGCCITCNGVTICAGSVSTSCGSCGVGAPLVP